MFKWTMYAATLLTLCGIVGELHDHPEDPRFRGKTEWTYNYSEVGALEAWDSPYCTVFLIEDDVAMTAAHCVDEDWLVRESVVTFIGEAYEIADIESHPDYGPRFHDIALIRLAEPVDSPFIVPVDLNQRALTWQDTGRFLTQVGFGGDGIKRATDPYNAWLFGLLSGTDWIIWDPVYTRVNPGDSGGPVYMTCPEQGTVVIAITTHYWRNPITDDATMNGGTRVDLYLDWIVDTIDDWRNDDRDRETEERPREDPSADPEDAD